MNTNRIIAEWLGIERIKDGTYVYWYYKKTGDHLPNDMLDFLNNRNQQKWIENELKKRGYAIEMYVIKDYARVTISPNRSPKEYEAFNGDGDLELAFIEAVLQLIKEEK